MVFLGGRVSRALFWDYREKYFWKLEPTVATGSNCHCQGRGAVAGVTNRNRQQIEGSMSLLSLPVDRSYLPGKGETQFCRFPARVSECGWVSFELRAKQHIAF